MSRPNTVEVCIDLERFSEPTLMGRLNCQGSRAGEIFLLNIIQHGCSCLRLLRSIPTLRSWLVLNTRCRIDRRSVFSWIRHQIDGGVC